MYDIFEFDKDLEGAFNEAKECRAGTSMESLDLYDMMDLLCKYFFQRGYFRGRKDMVNAAKAIVEIDTKDKSQGV